MSLFNEFLRPKGISEIVFGKEPTQIKFTWGSKNSKIFVNQNEWEKLSPELRLFVLMHEIGHLQTMPILKNTISHKEETEADNFAFDACKKMGIVFESPEAARKLYITTMSH